MATERHRNNGSAGIQLGLEVLLGLIVLWLVTLIGAGIVGYSLGTTSEPAIAHSGEGMFLPSGANHQSTAPEAELQGIEESGISAADRGAFIVVLSSVGATADLDAAQRKFIADAKTYNTAAASRNLPSYFTIRRPSQGGMQLSMAVTGKVILASIKN